MEENKTQVPLAASPHQDANDLDDVTNIQQQQAKPFFKKKKYWEYLAKRQFGDTRVITSTSEQDAQQEAEEDEDKLSLPSVSSPDKVQQLEQELVKVKSRLHLWKLAYKSLLHERIDAVQSHILPNNNKDAASQSDLDIFKVAMNLACLQQDHRQVKRKREQDDSSDTEVASPPKKLKRTPVVKVYCM